MKNTLSKALLCGVLASSFLLVNCQKAPNRGVKADTDPNAKGSSVPTVAARCDENALTAINARNQAAETLQNSLRTAARPPDADTKQRLTNEAEDLNTKTQAAKQAISALKVGDANANACTEQDPADQTKVKATHIIAQMDNQNRQLAAQVTDLTGEPNALTQTPAEGSPNQQLEVIPEVPEISIAVGSEMVIAKEELATILKDARSKDGESFIVNAALQSGSGNYQAALADNSKTVCKVDVAAQNAAVDSELKVLAVEPSTANDRMILTVNLQVSNEGGLSTLSCAIANASRATAPAAVRAALGDMIKKKEAAAAPGSGDQSPANQTSGDQSPAAPEDVPAPQAPASGDQTPAVPPASGDQSPAAPASGDAT